LDSKALIVTGASRGIGAETARLAAQHGWSVCVNYRSRRDEADAVVSAIEADGGTAIAVQADVSIESDVNRLFHTCDRQLGRLSGLVNNAGILETQARFEAIDTARAIVWLLSDEASFTTGAFIDIAGGK